jgi:hypothetical protein
MGVYNLHNFMFDVYTKAAIKEAFFANPEVVYQCYTLTEEELMALRSKDIYRLHKLGVNAYLLAPFAQLLGFQLTDLGDILRCGAEAERRQEQSYG